MERGFFPEATGSQHIARKEKEAFYRKNREESDFLAGTGGGPG
jgi:hypothetical protein